MESAASVKDIGDPLLFNFAPKFQGRSRKGGGPGGGVGVGVGVGVFLICTIYIGPIIFSRKQVSLKKRDRFGYAGETK